MNKVKQSYKRQYLPLYLYLDDLQRIYDIFKGAYPDCTIKADGYMFDNVAELKQLGKPLIDEIEFKWQKNELVKLEISKSTAHFYVSDEDDLYARGVLDKLSKVLKRRWIDDGIIFTIWGCSLFGLTALAICCQGKSVIVPIVCVIIWVVFTVWLFQVRLVRPNVIHNVSRKERQSFFARYAEKWASDSVGQLLNLILGAVFTAIVFGLSGLLSHVQPASTVQTNQPAATQTAGGQASQPANPATQPTTANPIH